MMVEKDVWDLVILSEGYKGHVATTCFTKKKDIKGL